MQRGQQSYDKATNSKEENHIIGKNIKALRKERGYSQEALAAQLHVVRQTVLKWKKEISVPDAEMLSIISDLFEVPVSELLGKSFSEREEISDINEVAKQLSVLNEQLANHAVRKRIVIRRAFICTAIAVFVIVAVLIFCFMLMKY